MCCVCVGRWLLAACNRADGNLLHISYFGGNWYLPADALPYMIGTAVWQCTAIYDWCSCLLHSCRPTGTLRASCDAFSAPHPCSLKSGNSLVKLLGV